MPNLNDEMREVLNGRYYATLATLNTDQTIHMTPVWYLFENDRLYVQSSSMSRKVKNIKDRPEVSLTVDVRRMGSEKWVCAPGAAEIVGGEESKQLQLIVILDYQLTTTSDVCTHKQQQLHHKQGKMPHNLVEPASKGFHHLSLPQKFRETDPTSHAQDMHRLKST